jgi:hypothetical protein
MEKKMPPIIMLERKKLKAPIEIPEPIPSVKECKSIDRAPSNMRKRSVKVVNRGANCPSSFGLIRFKILGPMMKPTEINNRVSGIFIFLNNHSARNPKTIISEIKNKM